MLKSHLNIFIHRCSGTYWRTTEKEASRGGSYFSARLKGNITSGHDIKQKAHMHCMCKAMFHAPTTASLKRHIEKKLLQPQFLRLTQQNIRVRLHKRGDLSVCSTFPFVLHLLHSMRQNSDHSDHCN